MSKNLKNLYLLTPADIRKIRQLAGTFEKALIELTRLRRITTLDDDREHHPPFASDLIEEASFIEYQLDFFSTQNQSENEF